MTFEEFENAQMNAEDEGWKVTDEASANWCLKKIAEAREQKEKNHQLVEAETKKYEEWERQETERLDGTILRMQAFLEPWLSAQVEGKKRKSIKLPDGTVGFHTVSDTSKDENAIMEFLKANLPQFIKTTESVKLAELKKECVLSEDGQLVTKDGEIVPGYTVTKHTELYTR